MKKILFLYSLLISLCCGAQDVADTMYIYNRDKTVERFAVAGIDSVTFRAPHSGIIPPAIGNHEAVDLGLSVKWAVCNVGASAPEESGGYYAWGETDEKEDYSWYNYKWCNGSSTSIVKYCTDSYYGVMDNKDVLAAEDDVASVKWGGGWRMPTTNEQRELLDNCEWKWTTQNGVRGYKVTSRSNGNSIFLPAAGSRDGTELLYQGVGGCYWAGTLCADYSDTAYFLCSYSLCYDWVNFYRYMGFTVRPVCE